MLILIINVLLLFYILAGIHGIPGYSDKGGNSVMSGLSADVWSIREFHGYSGRGGYGGLSMDVWNYFGHPLRTRDT